MNPSNRETVLISCYSFAPRQGSESGTGWKTAKTLASKYRVIVVCVGHYRQFFQEDDFPELARAGIEVVFFEAERFSWLRRLPGPGFFWTKVYYLFWQREAKEVFRALIDKHHPVVLQHVTWGTGRVVSYLTGMGVPVIFGPAGGFESAHWPLCRNLPILTKASEWFRNESIRRSMDSKSLRAMYQQVDLTLACTPESAKAMRELGAARIELMSNAGISMEQLEELSSKRDEFSRKDPVFTMLFVGRLVGLKGVEFLIRAAAKLPDRNWKLVLLGGGEEMHAYQRLCVRLNVADQVEFPGWVQQDQTWDYYMNSDIFVFSSLHESGGNAVVEAMAAGLPIVCLNQGGPAFCVGDDCGQKIAPASPEQVVNDLSRAMELYRSDPEKRSEHGNAGRKRCLEHLAWERRGDQLLDLVAGLIRPNEGQSPSHSKNLPIISRLSPF